MSKRKYSVTIASGNLLVTIVLSVHIFNHRDSIGTSVLIPIPSGAQDVLPNESIKVIPSVDAQNDTIEVSQTSNQVAVPWRFAKSHLYTVFSVSGDRAIHPEVRAAFGLDAETTEMILRLWDKSVDRIREMELDYSVRTVSEDGSIDYTVTPQQSVYEEVLQDWRQQGSELFETANARDHFLELLGKDVWMKNLGPRKFMLVEEDGKLDQIGVIELESGRWSVSDVNGAHDRFQHFIPEVRNRAGSKREAEMPSARLVPRSVTVRN